MLQGFNVHERQIVYSSRKILNWSFSNSWTKSGAIETIGGHHCPNTGRLRYTTADKGAPITSGHTVDVLKENNIQISMDGKGRALDKHYIERFLEVDQI